ncbi:collagen alpha-1(XII) chain-like [Lissotriton helveticus]
MASTSAPRSNQPPPTESSGFVEDQMASTSARRGGEPPPTVGSELRGLKRQAITLGVMTAVSTFVTIVLYRLVEREIFYNPKARSSADLQSYAKSCIGLQHAVQNDDQSFQTTVASLLKTTRCLRPAEKNDILFQKAPTQCDQHNKQGGGGQNYTCARDKPGTEDSSSWMGALPYLRETLCLDARCSGRRDIKADVVLLIDAYFILSDAAFHRLLEPIIEPLVRGFHVSPDSVRFHLVLYSRDPNPLGIRTRIQSLRRLINILPRQTLKMWPNGTTVYTGARAIFTIARQVLTEDGGTRPGVPRILFFLRHWGSNANLTGLVQELWDDGVEVFVLTMRNEDYTKDLLRVIPSPPAAAHLFIRSDYEDLQRIQKELTESMCLRIQYKMKTIKHNLMAPKEEAEAGEP